MCLFSRYRVAGPGREEKIAFVLRHALAMRAIQGGKARNDRIDSHKITVPMRGGMFPEALGRTGACCQFRKVFRLFQRKPQPHQNVGDGIVNPILRGEISYLIEWRKSPEQTRLRRSFSIWINRVLKAPGDLEQTVPNDLTEIKTMLSQRIPQSIREAELQGEARGEAKILLKQINLKFGLLSDWAEQKIARTIMNRNFNARFCEIKVF